MFYTARGGGLTEVQGQRILLLRVALWKTEYPVPISILENRDDRLTVLSETQAVRLNSVTRINFP